MPPDIYALDWMGELFGAESCQEGVLEWLRQAVGEKDETLNREIIEAAHLFVVLGWMERRLFSQQLAAYDITIPQFFTLMVIHHCRGGCTMGLLAERTHQCSATLTGIVDRLLKMGLVERARSENDRRLVLVQITETGKRILQESLLTRFEALKKFLLRFDDHNRQQFIQSLRSSLALMRSEMDNLLPLESPEDPTSVSC